MNKIVKVLAGAATVALVTVSTATPAQARHNDDGIDVGEVIAGVAVVGGIAAAVGAISNATRGGYDYGTYGRGYGTYGGYGRSGYGYDRYGYGADRAVQSCTYQAQRYGQGRVSVTDIDQRSRSRFRVRGVIDGGGYDYRYGRGYGYDRYGYDRIAFECDARYDGRITDFDVDRRRY
jgi:hypothetical protein